LGIDLWQWLTKEKTFVPNALFLFLIDLSQRCNWQQNSIRPKVFIWVGIDPSQINLLYSS
jgi:hypothetical protein